MMIKYMVFKLKMNKTILPEAGREFSIMPLWFWNDDLDEREIIRQIEDFEQHGVYGFVIHPRMGLPRPLGWMSPALLNFYQIAIDEAARRDMKVILYDEGMYPSGSSCGQVVAANPGFQCRCLAMAEMPEDGGVILNPGENLVAVTVRSNGRRMAVFDRKLDSVIRGIHFIGDGPDEDTPPAGDILNPAAADKFVELVYDGFAALFKKYFGSTITGIFTDEPSITGRAFSPGVIPGTTGILPEINRILGYDFTPHLPALWFDTEPDAEMHRAAYHRALLIRLEETYYSKLHQWCEKHHLPLMGHPEGPDHIGALRYFDIPGQDLVWRWVLPDAPSALEGPQSTQGKCSSSAMVHLGRRRNLNEYCGAYGHEFTWEEMNWLSNWCLVRGVNQLVPHAFYYSVRGPRKDERPPDVGPNSPWWNRYHNYADACRRLCWLNTDCRQICRVAIIGGSYELPWHAAEWCFQHQYDFNYLEERHLYDDAEITADGIRLREMHYQIIIADSQLSAQAEAALSPLGGRLLHFNKENFTIPEHCQPTVRPDRPAAALRARHLVKTGCHWFMLFNEEAPELDVKITLPVAGDLQEFDPEKDVFTPVNPALPLHFSAHQLRVLAVAVSDNFKKL